jgi:hypothetical protein
MIRGCNATGPFRLAAVPPDFTTFFLMRHMSFIGEFVSISERESQVWMRFTFLLVLSYLLTALPAQANVWQHVSASPGSIQLQRVTVSKAQFDAIRNALTASGGTGWQSCDVADGADWTQALIFEELPVSATEKAMLVEAGSGCARGGQGANGAMWVLRFEGAKPVLLATPQHRFNGWLYSIQPTTSHGLPDLVLGWHMSARETGLSYFQFDGASYRLMGIATLLADADGNAKIIPSGKQK